jgi:hypothetical protein
VYFIWLYLYVATSGKRDTENKGKNECETNESNVRLQCGSIET